MMAILKCIQCLQREENVPMELQKQVIDYYEYFWKAKKGVHLTDVYNDMTLSLKAKIFHATNKELLQKVKYICMVTNCC